MSAAPHRLPDVASIEAVLAGLDADSVDAELIPALTAFPGFEFSLARIDDKWMTAELAKNHGDTAALWHRPLIRFEPKPC